MVLDMARPKNKQSTIWPRMRGREVARTSTRKVNILQVFTIDFSEIKSIVNRNSQSDGQNKKCKEWDELAQEDHTYRLTPEEKEKIPRTMVSYLEQGRQKWAYETSIWLQSRCHDEKSLAPRIRRTNWRAHPSRSTKTTMAFIFKHNVVGQVWVELEVSSYFSIVQISFCYRWFHLQSIAIHWNQREVQTDTTHHTRLSRHFNLCTHHIVAQGEPHAWGFRRTRSRDKEPSLDTDGERQCSGKV